MGLQRQPQCQGAGKCVCLLAYEAVCIGRGSLWQSHVSSWHLETVSHYTLHVYPMFLVARFESALGTEFGGGTRQCSLKPTTNQSTHINTDIQTDERTARMSVWVVCSNKLLSLDETNQQDRCTRDKSDEANKMQEIAASLQFDFCLKLLSKKCFRERERERESTQRSQAAIQEK